MFLVIISLLFVIYTLIVFSAGPVYYSDLSCEAHNDLSPGLISTTSLPPGSIWVLHCSKNFHTSACVLIIVGYILILSGGLR